jgi:hypothetical protein
MRVKCIVETPSGMRGGHCIDEVNEQLVYIRLEWLMDTLGWKINSFVVL